MIKIGITGSIASGKSTFAKFLSQRKYPIFDADRSVASIYRDKYFLKKSLVFCSVLQCMVSQWMSMLI